MHNLLLVVMLICCSSYALAEQNFSVKNNATIVGIASKQEITRINFRGEKVAALHYIGNEFHYDIYESDVYLKAAVQEKPINFFVRTENGRTYKFILEIKDIPATQIFVDGQYLKKQILSQEKSQKTSLFKQNVSQLLKVLEIEEPHLGFIFKARNKKSKRGDLGMHSVLTASGKGLVGEKIILQNNSQKQLQLHDHEFMGSDIAAVHLVEGNLLPGERTTLMLVKRSSNG